LLNANCESILQFANKSAICNSQFAILTMRYIWLIPLLPGVGAAINGLVGIRFRSEERRVGKECRSRWSPYH